MDKEYTLKQVSRGFIIMEAARARAGLASELWAFSTLDEALDGLKELMEKDNKASGAEQVRGLVEALVRARDDLIQVGFCEKSKYGVGDPEINSIDEAITKLPPELRGV